MKIRNGFVSNSSSSSFIVSFPKKINTYEELFDLMWTDSNIDNIQRSYIFKGDSVNKGYNFINITFAEFQKWATNVVLRDVKEQGENNYLSALSKFLSDGWYDDDTNVLSINDFQFRSIEDINLCVKRYNDINNNLNNFNWKLFSEEYYDFLSDIKSELYWVSDIISTLDEVKSLLNKNPIFYSFSFADEDGIYFSVMEHGGIFGDLSVYIESFH